MYWYWINPKIRKEIFVPLSVGGGIENLDQVSKIINEGVEKVIINSINFEGKSNWRNC